jgi:hypothetical protein
MLEEGDVLEQRNLLFDCWSGIQKLLYGTSFEEMFLHQKRDIFLGQFLIEDAFGVNDHDRTFRAKAVASCDDNLHLVREAPMVQF